MVFLIKFKHFQVLFLVAIVCILNSCSSDDSPNTSTESATTAVLLEKTTNYTYTSFELETLNSINDYRISVGLKPLEKTNLLSWESEEHDEFMITKNQISHDGFGTRCDYIMKSLGAIKVGENVALSNDYSTVKTIVNAWLASPEHKKNIEGDYTHFGISIKEDPTTGKKYYTNIFAKL